MKINEHVILITAIMIIIAIAASVLVFSGTKTASAQSSPALAQFTALSHATNNFGMMGNTNFGANSIGYNMTGLSSMMNNATIVSDMIGIMNNESRHFGMMGNQ